MVYIDPDLQAEYQGAWLAWEKQLKVLHEVFLDGGSLDPPRLKGLLNREARAKVRYDTARLALLGIPAGAGPPESESPTIRPPGPLR